MSVPALVIGLLLLWQSLLAVGPAAATEADASPRAASLPDHVADGECLACHVEQARLWETSKHRRAMQPATADSVLGDFGGVHFSSGGESAHFFRRGERYFVATQDRSGALAEFPVTHTFGVHPLQQVLLPLPGGRLQALSVAWDTRRGQWFSLYPEGGFEPGSTLHWTGRYQNWNLMCGECHTTAYRKGYDDAADRYATTWAEHNVGCQACHGGGRAHAESARSLAQGGEGRPTPTPNRRLGTAHQQVDQCAACHARRTRLVEEAAPGLELLDQFMPDNLRAELYHADGQQLDEVFEYGSYRQSRMYAAGVACTDCHEVHSGRPRAEGNALCTACHSPSPDRERFPGLKAADYDSDAHHFHSPGKRGSQCVDCHMPSRNYMVVHGRRDHAIRVPRPDLTARIGVPNACQDCHGERPAEWAVAAIERHLGARPREEHYGEVLAAFRAGAPGAANRLAALVTDRAQPAIVRATALESLAQAGTHPVPTASLQDPDGVLRATAAAALGTRPVEERLAHLPALLSDPLRAVRIAAARGLADVGEVGLDPARRPLLRAGLDDFVAAQVAMADMPGAQLNLASLALVRRDPASAERHYRRAVQRDPALQAGRLGLATLLAGTQREDEAEEVLRAGLAHADNAGELHFALGLLAGQRQRWEEAARELRAAAALLPHNARVRRNLDAVEAYLAQRQRR
ncbi:cytochrome c3 family protein [Thauera sp.]|uniref:cytochrome c3 family protein n=1 Tax=Thauera sp. TaxID=1905334 RepID=UPI002BAC1E38|nr:cytochrome c3 family protein [Thauera sp.]HRP23876.1 multiheme c-type cytochrome [Thauera sp.]